MRPLTKTGFFLLATFSLFAACEPDLDELSSEYGHGGSGSGGEGSAQGGGANGGETNTSRGGMTHTGGAPGAQGGAGGVGGAGGGEGGATGGQGGAPNTDSCKDSLVSPDESDVDCGGASLCDRCPLNGHCSLHEDCASGVCSKAGRCVAPSCTDNLLNQDETAIDCGGSCAPVSPCGLGLACKAARDCASEFCSAKLCADHCISKLKEADETDVDCGGSCSPCQNDLACVENADCASNICKNKLCVPQTCTDSIKNQDETDLDCGGKCSEQGLFCAVDAKCNKALDCGSVICTTGRCQADITIPVDDMIDDLEDGNMVLLTRGGRTGNWYTFNDKTTTGLSTFETTALLPKRGNSSSTSLHYVVSGFTTWGSGIGFDFNNPGTSESTKLPWDASAYTGITFWGRATVLTSFSFQLADRNTHARGGVCTTCGHYWSTAVSLGTEWKRYTVRFADLVVEAGNVPAPTVFDKTGIVLLQMFFSSGKNTELWIDDVALIK